LSQLGYDYDALVPDVGYNGVIRPSVSTLGTGLLTEHTGSVHEMSSMPVTSAFRCAFGRELDQFSRLSVMSPSVVTASCGVSGVRDNIGGKSHIGTAAAVITSIPYVFGPGVLLNVDSSNSRVTGCVSSV
jgi:hypothetical protein